ncbi:alpha/beta fold hydrolase [Primorskyibacter sedentarius]|uniref:alpha/beta fold hydrolase n=1 Tax=Primorskyibacter sedentarius TaxID=745311 RepID=UPI003EB89124
MTLTAAPYYADVADGPEDARVFWVHAADGVRIRLGHWPAKGVSQGTVLLMPGRTEYIEKYGRTARDLTERGLDVLCIDWRGQGLADRSLEDPRRGHVIHFDEYQADLDAMMQAATDLNLPKPLHMLAHSMGGCIGLRGLMRDLPFTGVAFSGPMWGIRMRVYTRPAAWALSWSSGKVGLGHAYAPGTGAGSYVATEPFEGNLLTGDIEMFEYMRRQIVTHPDLQLGGPSLNWLHAALFETRALARMASPRYPCLTYVGSDERIVDVPRIHQRMARWPGGTLRVIDGGRHEMLMDNPEMRTAIADEMAAHYLSASDSKDALLSA